jgi:hypothetical protein
MFMKGPGAEISKCVARSLAGLSRSDPAALRSNAKCSQTKAGGRNAGYVMVVFIQRRAIHTGAVRNQARLRICFVPEIAKRTLLEIFKE